MARFTKRQLSAIEYVIKNRKITRFEYEKNYMISKRTAVRELKELVRTGIFGIKGKGPKTHYVFKTTVRYSPTPSDEGRKV